MTKQLASFSLREATPEDTHLEPFDHTKLSALNTCPTWGIIRYGMHLDDKYRSRAMALEAGTAAHEVYAAHRLWHLKHFQERPDLADFHGLRLFGKSRYDAMENAAYDGDMRQRMMHFCLEALMTSGFYDDPRDKRRTLSNLEEACIAYLDRTDYTHKPIWIKDPTSPTSLVGIEIPFDLVASWGFDNGETLQVRFTGRLDGIHQHPNSTSIGQSMALLKVHDNKTASRLDDAWIKAFDMSHQITGYMVAASLFAGVKITEAVVHGMAIPLPKSYDYGGIIEEPVTRNETQFHQWVAWFLYTVASYREYKDDPINAPKYTHSCNRYFHPCSMIPFCTGDIDEKKRILSELEFEEWSPLREKVDE